MNSKIVQGIVFFALLYSPSDAVYSQNQDFRFTHLATDHGLSQSNVICILQDNKGFMWFGTFNGLNKYDGYEFEVFHDRGNDSQSITHNYISALFQDRRGYLWVGTSEGLNRYDQKTNSFKHYKHRADDPTGLRDNQIEAILEDSRGRLWIGTRNGGLERFDSNLETFAHNFHEGNNQNGLSSNFIRVLFEDSKGNLWIGHWNGALDILPAGRDKFEKWLVAGEKLTDSPFTAIVESPGNEIWIGTQGDGLFRIKPENGSAARLAHYSAASKTENGINSNIILCLARDRENRLWIGTEDKGINILDIATDTFQYCRHDPFNPSGLNHDSIWSIYEDRAGDMWVGTYAHGINLLTRRKSHFQHYKNHPGSNASLSHNMVNFFMEDENKDLWIATDGGGLNVFDRSSKKFIHYNSRNSNIGTDVIVSLLEDRRGRLWVGTWTDGLYQFDRKTKKFARYSKEKHGLASNRILHILEDRAGGLWLSTFWGGLTYFNVDDQQLRVYDTEKSGLGDNDVRVVMQDGEGNLWIGTDVGLDFFNPRTETFVNYKHDEQNERSLSKGFVHSIVSAGDSILWIGATCGLSKLDRRTNTFTRYDTQKGLPDDEIKCIVEEENGILWLSTNRGISRFDTKAETFKNYDVSDGLQGNEFNARSGCRTAYGEIIFGGNNGFNIFQPHDLKGNPYIPPVVITDFTIFNKPVPVGGSDSRLREHISETKQLALSHGDAVFSFEFAALNYISPEKNQYAYMLEGFDSDWNYVGSQRTATYTNIDPGDYVFKLKASNNDGLWNENGVAIKITMAPPFWKTWWAYLLEALVLLAVVALVFNYFISRQRLKNALKIEHLELEKMYELDQMKTRFFANISHEFHAPMTLILSPLEKLITSWRTDEGTRQTLILMHRNAKRLQCMAEQLRDFQKIETGELQLRLSRGNIIQFIEATVNSFGDYAKEHQIRFQFKAEADRVMAWFDADKLDKIIYNLLSNAFKFTPAAGEITVAVTIIASETTANSNQHRDRAAHYIEISVQDSGIGIPEDKRERIFQRFYQIEDDNGRLSEGSGIGLAFVYELVKLYRGEISVSSREGQGTKFTVQIPIDEQFLEENQLVGEFHAAPLDMAISRDKPAAAFEAFDDSGMIKRKKPGEDTPVILIVEDDREIRNYLEETLESKYRVCLAENGEEGFKRALKIIPDLIISDIKMPELSGVQLCRQLKENENTSHIPVILLTGYSSRENIMDGLGTGADAYLTKPLSIELLEAQISNLLDSRKKLREKFSREIFLEPKKNATTDIDEKFLQRIIEAIEKNISDRELNADILSKEIGMSRMQLYRKLRGLTDQTVHEFIRSIRLKRAVQLLEERRMTITQVAYEVGFNDLTYFARCFRKMYKKSPSKYTSQRSARQK